MDIVWLGESTYHGITVTEPFGQTDRWRRPPGGLLPMTSIFPIIGSSALLDVDGNAGRRARDEDA